MEKLEQSVLTLSSENNSLRAAVAEAVHQGMFSVWFSPCSVEFTTHPGSNSNEILSATPSAGDISAAVARATAATEGKMRIRAQLDLQKVQFCA